MVYAKLPQESHVDEDFDIRFNTDFDLQPLLLCLRLFCNTSLAVVQPYPSRNQILSRVLADILVYLLAYSPYSVVCSKYTRKSIKFNKIQRYVGGMLAVC